MRCRVRCACGHFQTIYLEPQHDWRKRFDLYEHMRCKECRMASACELVTMTYSEYQNHYPMCNSRPNSYHADTRTIDVYVPRDYLENGSSSIDERAEELRAAVQILLERDQLSKAEEDALPQVKTMVLDYLRNVPLGSAFTAAFNAGNKLPFAVQYEKGPLPRAFQHVIDQLNPLPTKEYESLQDLFSGR